MRSNRELGQEEGNTCRRCWADSQSLPVRRSCKAGTNLYLSGCHRWQGPPPRSSRFDRRQAASERSEDRRRPLRGPQHLGRVLPRQAYVAFHRQWTCRISSLGSRSNAECRHSARDIEFPTLRRIDLERTQLTSSSTNSQVPCLPAQDDPLQPHPRWYVNPTPSNPIAEETIRFRILSETSQPNIA